MNLRDYFKKRLFLSGIITIAVVKVARLSALSLAVTFRENDTEAQRRIRHGTRQVQISFAAY